MTTTAAPAADRLAQLVAKYRTGGIPSVLADVQAKNLSPSDASAVIDALSPKAAPASREVCTLKVTDKGQVHIRNIRGINFKFGLPLYVEALEDILDHAEKIRAFVAANADKLSRKTAEQRAADRAAAAAAKPAPAPSITPEQFAQFQAMLAAQKVAA